MLQRQGSMGDWLLFFLAALCNVLLAITATWYYGEYVDLLSAGGFSYRTAIGGIVGYVLLEIVMIVANLGYDAVYAKIRKRSALRMRARMNENLLGRDMLDRVRENGKDYYTSLQLNDMLTYRNKGLSSGMQMVRSVLRLVFFLGLLFYYNGYLGGAALVGILLLYPATVAVNKQLEKTAEREAEQRESYLAEYEDAMSSRADYGLLGRDQKLSEKLFQENRKLEHALLCFGKRNTLVSAVNELISFAAKFLLIASGILLAARGLLTVGEVVATLTLVSLLEDELKGLIDLNQTRTAARAVKNRLRPMLRLPEQGQEERGQEDTAPIEELWLEGLSYSYEGKPLLKDMSLKIERGKRYALIGESGCGKTTTAKIMAGILRDYEGQIRINGAICEAASERLADQVYYLDQDFTLFQDTIENNLFFDRPEYYRNFEQSGFSEIVREYLPDFSKELYGNGENLSGGQRQILGLARGIAAGKRILIMDESFSAMDETVFSRIERYLRNRQELTQITVTHRYQNLSEYDVIYRFRDGKPEELLPEKFLSDESDVPEKLPADAPDCQKGS